MQPIILKFRSFSRKTSQLGDFQFLKTQTFKDWSTEGRFKFQVISFLRALRYPLHLSSEMSDSQQCLLNLYLSNNETDKTKPFLS